MSWYANLNISSKFNLILSFFLITLFLAAAIFTYKRQQAMILRFAVDNARNLAQVIIQTRNYMSDVVKGEPEANYSLVPQVVATQVAKRITGDRKYYLRQVSLRNRNPENIPDAYEANQLRQFKSSSKETYEIVGSGPGETFRYLLPMIAEPSCLECHGSYDTAPAFVRLRFPRGHSSYDYKVGEVIGAVSVAIPTSELTREIGINLKLDLANRAAIFLAIICVIGFMIRRSIINPVSQLSEAITRVARSGNFSVQLPSRPNDEIGRLFHAFNELMSELGLKTMQRQESDERYRNVIDMARSAFITFIEDGKIVIANNAALRLLGIPREDLIGISFFNFIPGRELLEQEMANSLKSDQSRSGESISLKLKDVRGQEHDVELSLSATTSEGRPMFTAIIHDSSKDQT